MHGAKVHGYHNHRITMAQAVAGLVAGDTEIDTAESVDVSYPGFFAQMKELGANVEVD